MVSTFIMLHNDTTILFQKVFFTPKGNPVHIKQDLLILPLPQPLICFLSIDLLILDSP